MSAPPADRPSGGDRRVSLLTPNARGALWMVGSAVCFTAMTSLVKLLVAYSPATTMFLSQIPVMIGIIPFFLRNPRVVIPRRFPLLMGRSLTTVGGAWLSYHAFQHLPLADANALSFTRALWMVPLAAVLLGERVTVLRVAALAVGFLGVILVANPMGGGEIFDLAHGSAIGSAMLLALTVISVKVLGRQHGTFSLLWWGTVLGLVLSFPLALAGWRWPTPYDALLIGVLGLCSLGAQVCYIKGMLIGDATAMAPIDYLRLVFAIASGIVFFGEFPTFWTLAGGGLIIVSTLSVTVWEAVAGRRRRIKEFERV